MCAIYQNEKVSYLSTASRNETRASCGMTIIMKKRNIIKYNS